MVFGFFKSLSCFLIVYRHTTTPTLPCPIADPYGNHALGCPRSLPYRTIFWYDPLRDAYASIGRIVGLRTRTEVTKSAA